MEPWKFDVTGMTPSQLRLIVSAIDEKIDRLKASPIGYDIETIQFLNSVVMRLRRALPDHTPFPPGTVL